MGAEGFTYTKDFVFTVLLNQSSYYPNLMIDRSEGRMRLYVDVPASIPNVRKMIFSKAVAGSDLETFASVIGWGHFELIDSTYTGEYAYYKVDVYLGDPSGTIFTFYTQGSYYAGQDAPEITVTPLKKRVIHYSGGENPIIRDNVGSYRIYRRAPGNYTVQLLGTNTNVNDTVFEATGTVFPGYYTFHIAPIPHLVPSFLTDLVAWDNYSNEVYTYVGNPSFYYYSCRVPEGPFIYYSSGFGEISEYFVEQDTVTHVFTAQGNSFYTYSVSPNAKYLLASTGSYNLQYLISILQPTRSNGSREARWSVQAMTQGSFPFLTTGSLQFPARTGLWSTISLTRQRSLKRHSHRMIDALSSAQTDSIFLRNPASFISTSWFHQTWRRKWNSSGTSGTIKYYTFYPGSPGLAALFIDQTFSTRNCSNWGLVSSFQADFTDLSNIDFTSGRKTLDLRMKRSKHTACTTGVFSSRTR